MKADISRNTYDPARPFERVIFQQGRPIVDYDLNEQTSGILDAIRTFRRESIGWHGTFDGGFKISYDEGAKTIVVGEGSYYVNGLRALRSSRRDTISEFQPVSGQETLVYLEAWERSRSPIEESDRVIDPLLNQDTCARSVVEWRIRAKKHPDDAIPLEVVIASKLEDLHYGGPHEPATLSIPMTANLPDGCYRLEVHKVGNPPPTLRWSGDNGSKIVACDCTQSGASISLKANDPSAINKNDDLFELLIPNDSTKGPIFAERLPASSPLQVKLSPGSAIADAVLSKAVRLWQKISPTLLATPTHPDTWDLKIDGFSGQISGLKNALDGDYWEITVRKTQVLDWQMAPKDSSDPNKRTRSASRNRRYFAPLAKISSGGTVVLADYRRQLLPLAVESSATRADYPDQNKFVLDKLRAIIPYATAVSIVGENQSVPAVVIPYLLRPADLNPPVGGFRTQIEGSLARNPRLVREVALIGAERFFDELRLSRRDEKDELGKVVEQCQSLNELVRLLPTGTVRREDFALSD